MLEQLLRAAGDCGLALDLRRRERKFSAAFAPGFDAEKARAVLYPLLAALEENFLVSVTGAPACLMPDAFEHFTWPLGARGRFRRIKACGRCVLSGRCPGLDAAWAGCSLLKPVLPVPAEIVLELNKKCNLACRACFGRSGEELPRNTAERALREAAALGVKSARFTGGEPLLYHGLERLLRLAKKLGFYTLLNTNSVLLSPARARALAGLVDNALISLPGPDEASHAAGSGRAGTLAAKTAAVKRLRAAGVKVVRAGTVVSRQAINNFTRWRAAVSALGFDLWELYRPMLQPDALEAAPEFKLSRRDFAALAKKVAAQPRDGARAVLANPVPFCALPAAALSCALGARFDDGWTRLVLDAAGAWKPSYPSCKFLGASLARAWAHPFLKKLRGAAWLPVRCRTCPMLQVCLGGSRFQAGEAGDVFGPDPWMAAENNRKDGSLKAVR
ncbi:MAG: radical SAM protein [Elusimicrobiales bacterium]|nr:radical SAM protein [Elusimicrobiales bacterium]